MAKQQKKSSELKKGTLTVEYWPLKKIIPYAGNPRKRSKKSIAKIAASIKEFGWRQPIVVDEKGVVLVGHGRRDAAELNGDKQAPVHQALGLSAAQKRAYRIADNRTNEETEWDDDLLSVELKGLQGLNFDLSLTGFDLRQVGSYVRSGPVDGEDDVPPVPKKPVTKRGDLWLLGEHRLLCGDATSAEDVRRLCNNTVPFLMVTDPPYGVEYDAEWRSSLDSIDRATSAFTDTNCDWTAAYKLFTGDVAYVWHAATKVGQVILGLCAASFGVRGQIIWRKPHFVISRGHYHSQHEPCLYAVREKCSAHWNGDRTQSTIWDVANKTFQGGTVEPKDERTGHSTQKPVELMRRPIINHTESGAAVYDPFLGSGTTLIACETESRRCVGLEIEPAYCDVIVARWEKFTGLKAERQRAKDAA